MRERRGVDGGERGRPSRREGLPDHSRVSAIFIFVMSFRLQTEEGEWSGEGGRLEAPGVRRAGAAVNRN